jgi:hypothetical protein
MTTAINLTDFKPIVIKNVLSEAEQAYVYECIAEGFPEELTPNLPLDLRKHTEYLDVPELGYLAYVKGFSEEFYSSVRETAEKALGLKLLRPKIHFARYTTKTGHKPQLRPHCDSQLKNPCVTLSIQLQSTLSWDLCAYDTCDNLSYNEAMVFSGSHQIHWRPEKDFSEDDYLDIMVVQLPISNEELPPNHAKNMEKLRDEELQRFFLKHPTQTTLRADVLQAPQTHRRELQDWFFKYTALREI